MASRKPEVQHPKKPVEAQSQTELAEAVRNVFSSADGEKVWNYLRVVCHYDNSSFVPGYPHVTSFYEGMRAVFIKLKNYREKDLSIFDQRPVEPTKDQLTDPAAALPAWLREDDE